MLQKIKNISQKPGLISFLFLILAGTSTTISSLRDDVFLEARFFKLKDLEIIAYPLIYNISTITDFIILNPLVIYFLRKTLIAIESTKGKTGRNFNISIYHRTGVALLSLAIGIVISALFIFLLFLIQDYLIDKSNENLRLIGFIIYILLWIPLFFVPLLYIHNLMVEKKKVYSEHITILANKTLKSSTGAEGFLLQNSPSNEKEFILTLESLEKYKNVVANFPKWPLPKTSTIPSLASIVAASIPLMIKIVALINSNSIKLPK